MKLIFHFSRSLDNKKARHLTEFALRDSLPDAGSSAADATLPLAAYLHSGMTRLGAGADISLVV